MERNRKMPGWVAGVVGALLLYQPSGIMAAGVGAADAISADPGSAVVLSEPASDHSKLLDMEKEEAKVNDEADDKVRVFNRS